MKKLLVLVLLLHGPIWSFHLPEVVARPDPPISMAAFPPGAQVGIEEHHPMDPNKKLLIALIFASTALGAIILSLMCLWNYLRKNSLKSHQKYTYSSDPLKWLSLTPFMSKHDSMGISCNKGAVTLMDYNCLKTATEDFRESNVLGVGGFGCVYKARLEENNHVAVKRLNGGTQDSIREFEVPYVLILFLFLFFGKSFSRIRVCNLVLFLNCHLELQTEVDLLGRIQHPNIISLLGYSIHGETRLLVYELMQNGSLETQLHGPSHGAALNWHQRMKIALDTARGLEYLHEHCNPKVIHRDLKSSNILLDSNFNAKLSDFGLAVTAGTQKKNIKLSGTLGYVAPEYLLDGKLTDKSDVYAFGVVLLELLLGRKHLEKLAPAQCQSIVTWAMPQLTDRSKLPSIVDPVIRNTMDLKHLYQVAAVAVLCVQQEPSYRPLITDVLYSLIPLVPVELGGTLKVQQPPPLATGEP
ncbi:probable receptor-like protein kinase At1g80640 isoform X1 [Actinidia eriantha]|uniref:probable receptor-like protein kinase At1g80640 isoform X1 n=1 Tax=Actinidia eriantha TaxID=165200 RepID=UPI00258AF7EE|nr:probable receptor-like protein kinase At1g80640 isoform X1 [Actinidia eriantha]